MLNFQLDFDSMKTNQILCQYKIVTRVTEISSQSQFQKESYTSFRSSGNSSDPELFPASGNLSNRKQGSIA